MQRILVVLCAVLLAMAGPAGGQDVADRAAGASAPRFLVTTGPSAARVEVEPSTVAILRRRVSLTVKEVSIAAALKEIGRQTGVMFSYDPAVRGFDRRVTVQAQGLTLAAALTEVLFESGLDVLVSDRRHLALVPRRGRGGAEQAGTIVGRVTDAKSGEGLAGAEVFLDGTRWRAATDGDGRYRLVGVEAGSYTLTARRVGYGKQSRAIAVAEGAEVTVEVALQPVATQLNEIVTTVTGEQRRVELGHVVGRINADSLVKEAPISSLSELLTGRVPGLQVFQSQGTVGGNVRVQIRGLNSVLLRSEPIVIVDGVRYTTAAADTRGFGQFFGPSDVEPTSPLNDLNPNDIESIEVVKGPSAATLYGTDAADGVLVITTKRGRHGPTRWNAYAKGTMTAIPVQRYPDVYWGWQTVGGVPSLTSNCILLVMARGACTQDSVTVLPNPLNDPQLTIFGNKPRWEYGANIAGGRQDLRYYLSGDFENATGPIQMPPVIAEQLRQQRGLSELPEEWRHPNTLTKLNLRANVNVVSGETADFRVNAGYVRSATRSLAAARRNPYALGAFGRGPTASYYEGSAASPAEAFLETSTEHTDRFFGNVGGQWRPLPWLATRTIMGLDLTSRNRYGLVRRGDAPHEVLYRTGAVQDDRVRQVAVTAELGAAATLRRGRLSARTAVGAQYVRNLNDALSSLGADLPPGGTSIGDAASVRSQQTYIETVALGGYVEETVGLNERLFLTGALRVDGASAFGQAYEAVAYPKVAASWLISEEPFLPRLSALDELRLRYAFGASGKQPRSTMARPTFVVSQAVESGAVAHVIQLNELGNPALRPERVREHEFGFDATALARRLQLEVTWFRRRTVDQIVRIDLPPALGSIYENLGLTTQRGFEAELTVRVLNTRPLSWDLTVQHGSHMTELVDLGGGFAFRSNAGGWVEGYPLGARFERPLRGYTDANGDGLLAKSEVQLGDTAVYLGVSTPPRSQTLTTVVGLFERRLRLSALLERRTGFIQLNTLGCVFLSCRAAVDPATPLAEQVKTLIPNQGEPGDFTRLREVTAALDLPLELTRALRLRSATLTLSARNLALWKEFSGPDPESSFFGGTSPVSGSQADGIPQGRSWTLRLDVGL